MLKRLMTCIGIAILIIGQVSFAVPEKVHAETAGDTLVIRVGYFGDDKDYRTKAEISKSEMEGLPAQQNYYTNMTRIGTIMTTVAEGPTLKTVLDAANIDTGSIKTIHLRTTDSVGKTNKWFLDFPVDKYIGSTLYYYPNIVENWKRVSEGVGMPLDGALKNKKKVDSIVAVKSRSTKDPMEAKNLDHSMMDREYSYRFCAGQTPLQEMVETTAYSSNESAYWIFGIDVTLWGSPGEATDLSLDLSDRSIKVGSTKKIVATIKGQELFDNKVDKKLKWSSSDNKIATVDSEGNVSVKSKGKVTITAETTNGIKRTIEINGTDDASSKNSDKNGSALNNPSKSGKAGGTNKDTSNTKKGKVKKLSDINAIEVSLGNMIMDGIYEVRPEMGATSIELPKEETDPKVIFYAGCVAFSIFAVAIFIRVKRFYREV